MGVFYGFGLYVEVRSVRLACARCFQFPPPPPSRLRSFGLVFCFGVFFSTLGRRRIVEVVIFPVKVTE